MIQVFYSIVTVISKEVLLYSTNILNVEALLCELIKDCFFKKKGGLAKNGIIPTEEQGGAMPHPGATVVNPNMVLDRDPSYSSPCQERVL